MRRARFFADKLLALGQPLGQGFDILFSGELPEPVGRDTLNPVMDTGQAAHHSRRGIGILAEIDGHQDSLGIAIPLEQAPEGGLQGMDDVSAAADSLPVEAAQIALEDTLKMYLFRLRQRQRLKPSRGFLAERLVSRVGVLAIEEEAGELEIQEAGDDGARMAVGDGGDLGAMAVSIPEGHGVGMKEERQDAHQGAVAIVVFAGPAGLFGRDTVAESTDGLACGDTDIEDLLVGRPVCLIKPAHKLVGDIPELVALTERIRQTKGQSAIVRPGARSLVKGTISSHIRDWIKAETLAGAEFDRNAERIRGG